MSLELISTSLECVMTPQVLTTWGCVSRSCWHGT
jgi:hypothetical protein